jgi:hypothetical protein
MPAIPSSNSSCLELYWVLLFVLAQCLNGFSADPIPTLANPSLKFELDIQPILTARGCNSGPCHGKARGQNGFALSLLGFDANMDYEAIVKNSRGRRLSVASPTESLLVDEFAKTGTDLRRLVEDIMWSMLNSPEFLYLD